MMAPILVELEKDYRGKAAVVFIDVREDYDAAGRFGIRAIPTQIFFDKNGREVSRHEGFMDKKAASDTLNKLLAK
jgi:thioredoxin 1